MSEELQNRIAELEAQLIESEKERLILASKSEAYTESHSKTVAGLDDAKKKIIGLEAKNETISQQNENLKLDVVTLKRQRDEFEDSFKTQMRKRHEDAQMVRLKAKRRNEPIPETPEIP